MVTFEIWPDLSPHFFAAAAHAHPANMGADADMEERGTSNNGMPNGFATLHVYIHVLTPPIEAKAPLTVYTILRLKIAPVRYQPKGQLADRLAGFLAKNFGRN